MPRYRRRAEEVEVIKDPAGGTVTVIFPDGYSEEHSREWLECNFTFIPSGPSPEEQCSACGGSGKKLYPSTGTWRGSAGGQMMTEDVCDVCWGGGPDRRQQEQLEKADRLAEAVEDYVCREAFLGALEVRRTLQDYLKSRGK